MTSIEGASATHDGGDSEPDMDVPHGTVSAAINKKAEVDADSLAEAQKLIEDWCNDKEKTARQFRQFKLMKVLGKRPRRGVGGKVIITSLLPNRLANAAYCCMQSIKERDWELSNEDSDVKNSVLKTDKDAKGGNPTHTQTQHVSNTYGAGSTAHRFNAAALSSEKALDLLQKTIAEGIYPECKLFSFQLGRYQSDDLIEEHDDAAYEDLEVIDKKTNTKSVQQCSRDIAVIYYLCKNWKQDMGGVLIDHVTHEEHVPQFNSLAAFHVPRLHEVTAVTAKAKTPRFSIFGWFYASGKLYQLKTGHKNSKKNKKRKANKKNNNQNSVAKKLKT